MSLHDSALPSRPPRKDKHTFFPPPLEIPSYIAFPRARSIGKSFFFFFFTIHRSRSLWNRFLFCEVGIAIVSSPFYLRFLQTGFCPLFSYSRFPLPTCFFFLGLFRSSTAPCYMRQRGSLAFFLFQRTRWNAPPFLFAVPQRFPPVYPSIYRSSVSSKRMRG